jgi:hypothetical protein
MFLGSMNSIRTIITSLAHYFEVAISSISPISWSLRHIEVNFGVYTHAIGLRITLWQQVKPERVATNVTPPDILGSHHMTHDHLPPLLFSSVHGIASKNTTCSYSSYI